MAIYSINDLEKISNIKAGTIRIWEQRYENLLMPRRTKTNIRYYDDSDLQLILNIALLNRSGIKISKIALMAREEIAKKVAAISEVNTQYDTQIDALMLSMVEMDEFKFQRIIESSIYDIGFERTIIDILDPFFARINILWLTGTLNPIQNNFMTYLIRQKVLVAIDQEPLVAGKETKKFILYLPEREHHELSLLFFYYILKVRRFRVIYLGAGVGLNDLRDACNIHRPDYLCTLINESMTPQATKNYLDTIADWFKESQVIASGQQIANANIQEKGNIRPFLSFFEMTKYLDDLHVSQEKKKSRDLYEAPDESKKSN